MVEVHFLPAQGGDFILLRYGDAGGRFHNILIDSGRSVCHTDYSSIMKGIEKEQETVDAIFLTHVDDDHIGGFLSWISQEDLQFPAIQRIFFNTGRAAAKHMDIFPTDFPEDSLCGQASGGRYSVRQGKTLLQWLEKHGLAQVTVESVTMDSPTVDLPLGARIRFISPSQRALEDMVRKWQASPAGKKEERYGAGKEDICERDLSDLQKEKVDKDSSVSNGSSIAFLFDFMDVRLAFLGDAFADICLEGLQRLGYSKDRPYRAQMVKLSHHGSPRNLSDGLVEALGATRYLMSARDGDVAGNIKVSVAKLLKSGGPVELYGNFTWPKRMFTEADHREFLNTGLLKLHTVGEDGEIEGIGEEVFIYGKKRKFIPYQLPERSH